MQDTDSFRFLSWKIYLGVRKIFLFTRRLKNGKPQLTVQSSLQLCVQSAKEINVVHSLICLFQSCFVSWVVASCTCNSGYIIIFSNIMDYNSMPLKSKKLNPDDFNLNAFQTLGIIFKQWTKNGYSHSQFLWITDLLCYMKYIFLFSFKALRNNIIYFQKPLCLATSSSRFR